MSLPCKCNCSSAGWGKLLLLWSHALPLWTHRYTHSDCHMWTHNSVPAHDALTNSLPCLSTTIVGVQTGILAYPISHNSLTSESVPHSLAHAMCSLKTMNSEWWQSRLIEQDRTRLEHNTIIIYKNVSDHLHWAKSKEFGCTVPEIQALLFLSSDPYGDPFRNLLALLSSFC